MSGGHASGGGASVAASGSAASSGGQQAGSSSISMSGGHASGGGGSVAASGSAASSGGQQAGSSSVSMSAGHASGGGSSVAASGSAQSSQMPPAGNAPQQNSGAAAASASASMSMSNPTPKPDGIMGKVKEIFKEGKEAVKSTVGLNDEKKSEASASASGSVGGGGSAAASAAASSGQKQEGIMGKLTDMAKKGKETLKETANEIKDKAKEVKNDIKQAVGLGDPPKIEGSASAGAGGVGGSIKLGGLQVGANLNLGGGDGKAKASASVSNSGNQQGGELPGPIEKVQKLVNKGTEMVKETFHKIEDKAAEVGEKVTKTIDETIRKPMSQVSGSGQQNSEGQMNAQAAANVQLRGDAREKHLMDVKVKQESELGPRPSNLKEIVAQAKAKGVIPKNEDRSALNGNHADEKSVAVEVMDKMHEISKLPVEKVLKPIDKVLGYEKDPLIRMYDNSHEILRRPLSLVAKPVESVLTGAFKTSDETKRDNEKLLQTTSDQERREARIKEELARKEDRSIVGEIADRTIELAEKPIEIILKPVDHALGFDKSGKRNPILKLIDEIYALSKKPVDAIAKPFESILRKMADDGGYQLSVRFQAQAAAGAGGASAQAAAGSTMAAPGSDIDPKLFTRLADGALNIADRVLTKPLEVVMKPLNHALGYDEPGKRNPIVDAAHQLKNATKIGIELFTKPLDRIIKEIAEIGAIKNDAEREALLERKRDEASRIVRAMDKLHDLVQQPWEIVLRPVDRALGINREGRKEPLLRAWDVFHQVMRTPIQVLSKPVEDALLGQQPYRPPSQRAGAKAQIGGRIGPIKAGASVSVGAGSGAAANAQMQVSEEQKKNFIIDGIRKVERIAAKPLEVITSPIRRLILGEDDEKNGSDTDKNNRMVQAKAMGQSGTGRAAVQMNVNGGAGGPDKIVRTLENMNNVVLKPLEVITQPIVDMISPENKKKKVDIQVQGQAQAQTGASAATGVQAQTQVQTQGPGQQQTQVQAQAQVGRK